MTIDRRDLHLVASQAEPAPKLSRIPPRPKPSLVITRPAGKVATPEQESIYAAVHATKSNLMVNALAGTGKTHVLEQVQLIAREKPILYLVFNRKNADEAGDKMLSTTKVKTINGMGHSIWFGGGRSLKGEPDTRKCGKILTSFIKEHKKAEADMMWGSYDQVISGVALAKALGYVPEGAIREVEPLLSQAAFHHYLDERPDDLVSELIDHVLRVSIKQAYTGIIDYNDQVYMPALFGGIFPKFPLVLVDERQDLSPTNAVLVDKLVKTSRLICVGDPNQNIYGFRGAQANGMAEAAQKYAMTQLTLSVSFRCPSAIVSHVHWHVPEFKAFRSGGRVSAPVGLGSSTIPADATFICRNNAPLFAVAFKLLAEGHSVSVAGSDIGPKLLNTMRRLGPESLTRNQALSAIEAWVDEKIANGSRQAPDIAACMRIFCRKASTLGSAITYAEHLFAQRGSIQLLTGHKAKGLEFPTVYHLDPFLCADTVQDRNLRYVISTRSQDRLVEIHSDAIKWDTPE